MSISATAHPPMRVMGKEIRLKAFSSAYEHGAQYPHQSANGRRELRAMDKENATSSPRSSQNSAPASREQSRNRSKVNSVDTAIHVPSAASRDAMNEYESEDFQRKYNAWRAVTPPNGTIHPTKTVHSPDTELPPDTPDFSGMDDGTGQPVAVAGAPVEHPKRGIHIPARTRYGCTSFKGD